MLDARDSLLLPGLHDHHIHIAASAAALASVACCPPEVAGPAELAHRLGVPGRGWLRGIGYHESVAGMIDRDWLDAVTADRPVRVQYRSGRMWVFNSFALDELLGSGAEPPPGLEREGERWNGRLFDEDTWLRQVLGSTPPPFDAVDAALARFGVTGVTEMSPANGDIIASHFATEHARGALPQRVRIAGSLELGEGGLDPVLSLGPVKIHLHEEHLPSFDDVVTLIRAAPPHGRGCRNTLRNGGGSGVHTGGLNSPSSV